MRSSVILGASALVLALGVATASAEEFNPVTGYHGSAVISSYGAPMSEGRAAAIEGLSPYYRSYSGWAEGSPVLEQFHEAGR